MQLKRISYIQLGWQYPMHPAAARARADRYHADLSRKYRPCRWVGHVDGRGMPVVGKGQWVSDAVGEVGDAAV